MKQRYIDGQQILWNKRSIIVFTKILIFVLILQNINLIQTLISDFLSFYLLLSSPISVHVFQVLSYLWVFQLKFRKFVRISYLSHATYPTNIELTLWSGVVFERLIVPHVVKKYPSFMEHKGSLASL